MTPNSTARVQLRALCKFNERLTFCIIETHWIYLLEIVQPARSNLSHEFIQVFNIGYFQLACVIWGLQAHCWKGENRNFASWKENFDLLWKLVHIYTLADLLYTYNIKVDSLKHSLMHNEYWTTSVIKYFPILNAKNDLQQSVRTQRTKLYKAQNPGNIVWSIINNITLIYEIYVKYIILLRYLFYYKKI